MHIDSGMVLLLALSCLNHPGLHLTMRGPLVGLNDTKHSFCCSMFSGIFPILNWMGDNPLLTGGQTLFPYLVLNQKQVEIP